MGKLNWSGFCAISKGRHQCCEENCIIYPICLIKDVSRLTSVQSKVQNENNIHSKKQSEN